MNDETKTNTTLTADLYSYPMPVALIFWFYAIAPRKIVEIWGNYLAAVLHYFSITLLLRTLFAPWHRDTEGYGVGFDLSRYFRVFSMNMVSRGVGFVMRAFVIVFGLALECIVIVSGIFSLFFWLATPFIVVAAAILGFNKLL